MDEAIREHLELKRRLGASEEELERKENEAFGRGATGVAAASTPASDVAEPPGDVAEPPAAEEAEVAAPEPTPRADILDEEIGPDEVLPEESLQAEPASAAPRSAERIAEPAVEPAAEPEPEPEQSADLAEDFDDIDPSDNLPPGEDPLEGTPEFLEQSPDQERLWFEQGPPKDFNFDD